MDERSERLQKNAERNKLKREVQTAEERREEMMKDARRKELKRKAQTGEEKREELMKDAKRKKEFREKFKNDKRFKQTQAMKKRSQRDRAFKRRNETIHGRERNFRNAVRDGPIYPCICCHRLQFNDAVVEIEEIQEFKELLNGFESGFFEATIEKVISNF